MPERRLEVWRGDLNEWRRFDDEEGNVAQSVRELIGPDDEVEMTFIKNARRAVYRYRLVMPRPVRVVTHYDDGSTVEEDLPNDAN